MTINRAAADIRDEAKGVYKMKKSICTPDLSVWPIQYAIDSD
jgi:hypothetical protein